MIPLELVPHVNREEILKVALEKMGLNQLGIVCIVDDNKILLGILTDGDIRRKILRVQKPFSAFFIDDALDHAILSPVTIKPQDTLVYAVNVMGNKYIWDLPVVNHEGELVGLLHLHPAIKSLIELV